MKNSDGWQPSKYVMVRGRLLPTTNAQELAPSSLLIGRLLTDRYQPALATHARGRLLDLGCGKVPFYSAYREFVSENICADWPRSLHQNEHTDVFCDSSRQLPFADGSFDTILSSDVIEHLPDPVLAFQEIGRVLRPGGKLILNTPFLYMLHEVPHDYYRHTRYSLERLSGIAGMDVLELDEIGGIADVLTDMAAKALTSIPGLGRLLARTLQRAAIELAKTRLWRRGRDASSGRFPLGYFLVAVKR